MTDDTDINNPNAQWAHIFNTFGQDNLREILFDVAASLHDAEEKDRRVIEFRSGENFKALDITDHHDTLEKQQT